MKNLTREQDAAYAHELDEFYADRHWQANYHDSPWISGDLCEKLGPGHASAPNYWQCYSPRCANPTVASFSCGGNVSLEAAWPSSSARRSG